MDAVLTISRLSFAYPGQPPLADDWSAAFPPGVSLVLGDTGSGKTTLLRLIAGELPATHGALTLAGASLAADPAAYRARIAWHDPTAPEFDNVPVDALAASLDLDPAAWAAHAAGFALGPHLHKPLYMLSTGSRRKVWLAASLASRRPLTLLDEPTGALDARSIDHLMAALGDLAGTRERAIVVASSQRDDAIGCARVIELPLPGGR